MLIDELLWTKLAYASMSNEWHIVSIHTTEPSVNEVKVQGIVLFRKTTAVPDYMAYGTAVYLLDQYDGAQLYFVDGHYDMDRDEAVNDLAKRISQ